MAKGQTQTGGTMRDGMRDGAMAKTLGVSAKTVAPVRPEVTRADRWTAAGQKKLAERLDVPTVNAQPTTPEAGGGADREDGRVSGKVEEAEPVQGIVAMFWTNPRLIGCRIPGREGICRVRVHRKDNFVKGMSVPVRLVQDDLYELVGRCPRWRGRF